MVVGITGRIGSGKSTVANFIVKKYNFLYYDTDEIFKDLKSKGIFDFTIADKYKFFSSFHLQNIIRHNLHPKVFIYIKNDIDLKLKLDKELNFVIETALPSNDFFKICDITINITSKNKDLLLLRERNIDNKMIKLINKSQNYYNKFYKRCDFFIKNNRNILVLYKNIDNIVKRILEYR